VITNTNDMSDCEYKIRQATIDDIPEVLRIWLAGQGLLLNQGLGDSERYKEDFRRKIESQDETFQLWLAEDDQGNVLGWQSLSPFTNSPIVKRLYAESSTYICPNQRVRGLGKTLVAYALAQARLSSLQYVIAFVVESNTAALRIGEQLGFAQLGILPSPVRSPKIPSLVILAYEVPAPGRCEELL
jgi:L-amino acid N-acyltransferase